MLSGRTKFVCCVTLLPTYIVHHDARPSFLGRTVCKLTESVTDITFVWLHQRLPRESSMFVNRHFCVSYINLIEHLSRSRCLSVYESLMFAFTPYESSVAAYA